MILPYPQSTVCYKRAVGVFTDRQAAKQALQSLQASAFPMDRVSMIVRKDYPDQSAQTSGLDATTKVDEGAAVGAISGGALGGLTGLLVGLGSLAIPGVGPVMLAGATATTIATTLAGGAIGAVAGGLLGALIGLEIPEAHAKIYCDRVAQGDCLVMIEGTDEEIAIAGTIFNQFGIEEYRVYAITAAVQPTASIPLVVKSPKSPVIATPTSPHSLTAPTHAVAPTNSGIDFTKSKYGIGMFSNSREAELAINDLEAAGVPLNQVSLVTLSIDQPDLLLKVSVRDRLEAMRLGMSAERARFYNDQLTQGNYIITVSGTEPEVRHAATVLSQRGIQAWQMYDPTAIEAALPLEPPLESPENSVSENSVREKPGTVLDAVAAITGTTTAPADYTLPTPSSTKSKVSQQKRAIGVFTQLQPLADALTKLQTIFPRHQLSMMTRSIENIDAQLGRHFVGLGSLAVPGLGTVLVAGSEAPALIANALSEGAIATAARGLIGALMRQGIPELVATTYNNHLIQGHYLVIAQGTVEELHLANQVFNQHGILAWRVYGAGTTSSRSSHQKRSTPRRTTAIVEPDRDIQAPAAMHYPEVTLIDHRHTVR